MLHPHSFFYHWQFISTYQQMKYLIGTIFLLLVSPRSSHSDIMASQCLPRSWSSCPSRRVEGTLRDVRVTTTSYPGYRLHTTGGGPDLGDG